jgi:hypothetical protein
MLCRNCWSKEARVHFRRLGPDGDRSRNYCFACAQHEPLTWLLAWGHRREHHVGQLLANPHVVLIQSMRGRGLSASLVATGIIECVCGCRIVGGAELPCDHRDYAFHAPAHGIEHMCHCGRELLVPVLDVLCRRCGATQNRSVIAAAEACQWNEQRRRIVGVDADLRRGRVTWGTFAVRN